VGGGSVLHPKAATIVEAVDARRFAGSGPAQGDPTRDQAEPRRHRSGRWPDNRLSEGVTQSALNYRSASTTRILTAISSPWFWRIHPRNFWTWRTAAP